MRHIFRVLTYALVFFVLQPVNALMSTSGFYTYSADHDLLEISVPSCIRFVFVQQSEVSSRVIGDGGYDVTSLTTK